GMVCVVGRMRDLILQLSKSSIYSTKPHSSKDGTLLERTITVTLPSGQTTSLTRYQSIDNKSGQAQDD
ncbi:hypothetical protein RYZ85_23445, partial [Escherichia coli]|nr:hypothetical protein [Escherichia coli]